MGAYQARDLLLPPSQISLARIPLAIVFPFVVDQPWMGSLILALAGFSDIIDGWWARRWNMATAMGAVVDPITDKLFVLTVVVSLVVRGPLDIASVILMSTREIGELPLVVWLAASAHARKTRREEPRAIPSGKLATAVQFLTVMCALWRSPWTHALVIVTAILGVVAAVGYWRRMVRSRANGEWGGRGSAREDRGPSRSHG